ncbi:MAG: D-glycero-beta-D-manno-heptose-7-phosphate kinase [candidate division KSB1 bacterium]|nr:D-glycero-beta-D-manno-heptose-7-phosphate kinase [candidate division KSB1 bacterium]
MSHREDIPDISRARAEEILAAMRGRRIVVVGDLMLDRYVWGVVSRISPEAPVPVVEVTDESARLGGAANVVNNLLGLGAVAYPVGVIGPDPYGEQVQELLVRQGIPTRGVIIEEGRTTTVKTRVIAHSQHVVRVDRESRAPIREETQAALLGAIAELAHRADAILFEDYNKGVLTPALIEETLRLAAQRGILTSADPKFDNFFAYRGVTLFKPNRKEAEASLGKPIRTAEQLEAAGRELKRRLGCQYLMITLGEEGLALFGAGDTCLRVPTRARKVADVSGAGDTVISTATLAMVAGATPVEAALLANYAAGVVCGEVGVVPIEAASLLAAVDGHL